MDNYTQNWGFSFMPYGSKITINFKEKQIDRNDCKEILRKILSNIIPEEIYLFHELKNQKGRDKQALFQKYESINAPSQNEVLFLNAYLDDNEEQDVKEEIVYKISSEFSRSEKPNNYIFKLNKISNLKTKDNIKQILLANDYTITNFRFSIQFYKPMSLFGPIISESFLIEIKDNTLKARITKKGIANKKGFSTCSLFKFDELNNLFTTL